MARIPPIDLDHATEDVREAWSDIDRTLGRVPNFIATVAHSPAVVRWLVPFVATLHREGTGSVLDARTKNLVVLKTSFVNGCEYCIGHNRVLGESLGVTDELVDALERDDYMDSPLFDGREKAVIWWADEVTKNTARSNPECFDNLRAYFDNPEIVELTLISGLFNMVNRFNDSLHVDLEGSEQISGIRKTRYLPQSTITDYVRHRIEYLDRLDSTGRLTSDLGVVMEQVEGVNH